MKLLWLYRENPNGDMNTISKRIHYDFINKLRSKEVELSIYGPGVLASVCSPVLYDPKLTMSQLKRVFKPDAILLYSTRNINRWVPPGFGEATIPKIMIECDWWNVLDSHKLWMKKNHIGLLIQRGNVGEIVVHKIPCVWLPFSASEEHFVDAQSIPLSKRKRLIAFVGRGGMGRSDFSYINRRAIIHQLSCEGLVKCKGKVGHEEYSKWMRRFFCYITDCGRLDSPPAKVFEIMASGALLFTTPFNGKAQLFGEKEVCVFYEKDRSNLISQARKILNVKIDNLQKIADAGAKAVNEAHLDSHRIKELYDIIFNFLDSGTVVKKWGV